MPSKIPILAFTSVRTVEAMWFSGVLQSRVPGAEAPDDAKEMTAAHAEGRPAGNPSALPFPVPGQAVKRHRGPIHPGFLRMGHPVASEKGHATLAAGVLRVFLFVDHQSQKRPHEIPMIRIMTGFP